MIFDIDNYKIEEVVIDNRHRLCPYTEVILVVYRYRNKEGEVEEAYSSYIEERYEDGLVDVLFETCFDNIDEATDYFEQLIVTYE